MVEDNRVHQTFHLLSGLPFPIVELNSRLGFVGMSWFRLTGLILVVAALCPQRAAAQYQNPQNPIGSIIGGLLRNAMVTQAQNEWRESDQNIVACINSSGSTNVPTLVTDGILPTDPRLSALIQQCQNEIAAQQLQEQQQQQQAAEQQQQAAEQQQQAEAAAQQAAQQQAQAQAAQQQADAAAAQQQAQAQAEQQAQASADAQLMAQEQATTTQVKALFIAFQNKVINPNDNTASLLNYTSFGSDTGSVTNFWTRKSGATTTYVEYQEGATVQEPAEVLQEVDVSTIDPSKLYIQEQSGSAITTFGPITFASCQSCSVQTLQSRWVSFFQTQSK